MTDYDEPGTGLLPKNIHKKVEKIKTIKIPSTVKILTYNCFRHLRDGKNINIPAGVTENVIFQFTVPRWNKITVSPKNKDSKIPPTLTSMLIPSSTTLTIYVPKNCKNRYMERWKELTEDEFSKIMFIEMK